MVFVDGDDATFCDMPNGLHKHFLYFVSRHVHALTTPYTLTLP